MTKTLITIFILFLSLFSNGQDFKYVGKVDSFIISKMTGSELLMYSECVTMIGKEREVIDWASDDIVDLIKTNPNHFKYQIASIDSKEKKVKIKPQNGSSTLGSEKFLMILERKKNQSTINFLVFY
jgi:hypothetical protein